MRDADPTIGLILLVLLVLLALAGVIWIEVRLHRRNLQWERGILPQRDDHRQQHLNESEAAAIAAQYRDHSTAA